MGVRLDEARADGIVLFNRFYQPDFDIDHLEISPSLNLSRPEELLLRLHWTAILCGHVRADLGITGGVHNARDVIKCIYGWGKGCVYDLGVATQWRAPRGSRPHRSRPLARGTRIQFGTADVRKYESRSCAGSQRVRTRQLHEGSQLVHPPRQRV
jgi:hypothetical protein